MFLLCYYYLFDLNIKKNAPLKSLYIRQRNIQRILTAHIELVQYKDILD